MFVLLVAGLFALGFAFIATQNTAGVTLRLGSYTWSHIPLYIVAVGSLLLGLFVGWVLSLLDWASVALTMRGKDSRIKKSEVALSELHERVRALEVENAHLKGEKTPKVVVHEKEVSRPSVIDRFRNSLSMR